MVVAIKTIVLAETCVTNHGLINFIMVDTLRHQGRSWEEFIRKKARTTLRKQTGTSEEAPVVTKEQPQRSKVRVGKRPVENPIGDR